MTTRKSGANWKKQTLSYNFLFCKENFKNRQIQIVHLVLQAFFWPKKKKKKSINFGVLKKKTKEGFEPTTFGVRTDPEGSADTLNRSAEEDLGTMGESLQLID